jgi:hypothetical protein
MATTDLAFPRRTAFTRRIKAPDPPDAFSFLTALAACLYLCDAIWLSAGGTVHLAAISPRECLTYPGGQTMVDVLSLLCSYWWAAFFFVAIFGSGIFAWTRSLIQQRQLARRREQENDLKRDMVAKGFSPAEIERVIQARSGGATPTAAGDDIRLPEYRAKSFDSGAEKANLIAALAEQGMEAEGIELILKALGESADDELPGKLAAAHHMVEQNMDAAGIERVIRAFHTPAVPRGKDETAFKE